MKEETKTDRARHPKDILTVAQVADEYHLSDYQQRHLRETRRLKYFRFGKGKRLIGYYRADVDLYFEEEAGLAA